MLVSPFPMGGLYIQTHSPLISHYHHDSDDGDTNKLMMAGRKVWWDPGLNHPMDHPASNSPSWPPYSNQTID